MSASGNWNSSTTRSIHASGGVSLFFSRMKKTPKVEHWGNLFLFCLPARFVNGHVWALMKLLPARGVCMHCATCCVRGILQVISYESVAHTTAFFRFILHMFHKLDSEPRSRTCKKHDLIFFGITQHREILWCRTNKDAHYFHTWQFPTRLLFQTLISCGF